jgi:hypothetical protein
LCAQVSDYLIGAINGDWQVAARPFAFIPREPDVWRGLFTSEEEHAQFQRQWEDIVAAVNDPSKLQQNWRTISIVSKLLVLAHPDDWSRRNLKMRRHQGSLWWVRTAAAWFAEPAPALDPLVLQQLGCTGRSTWVYLHICNHGVGVSNVLTCFAAVSALSLELFYRFVWAVNTLQYLQRRPAAAPATSAEERSEEESVAYEVARAGDAASVLGGDEVSEAPQEEEDIGASSQDGRANGDDGEADETSDSRSVEDVLEDDEGSQAAVEEPSPEPAASLFFMHPGMSLRANKRAGPG